MFMGVNAEHLSTRLRSLKASLFDLAAPSGSDAQVHFYRLFGKYREVQDHPFMVVIYGPHLTHGIHSCHYQRRIVRPQMASLVKNPEVKQHELDHVRMVMGGAAPVAPELEAALRQVLRNANIGQG